jgi:hypothetical protein
MQKPSDWDGMQVERLEEIEKMGKIEMLLSKAIAALVRPRF